MIVKENHIQKKPMMKRKDAMSAIHRFFREKPFVFFGSGTSCALDYRFGMGALKDELIEKISHVSLSPLQRAEWDKVLSNLEDSNDFESAMNAVSDHALLNTIIVSTGQFIASIDREYAFKMNSGKCEWTGIGIINKLMETISSNPKYLSVLTPNYDMLFEYACDRQGIPFTNGYVGGIIKKKDWNIASLPFVEKKKKLVRKRFKVIDSLRKHIRIYKVHGSLNLFDFEDCVVENNTWIWSPPEYVKRVIITPGLSKYQSALMYRKELLAEADLEIEKAGSFLFLGYGFNDPHLDNSIKRKIQNNASKCLVITRNINHRIVDLISLSSSVWVICRGSTLNDTRIYNSQYSEPLELKDVKLWDFSEFSSAILGG